MGNYAITIFSSSCQNQGMGYLPVHLRPFHRQMDKPFSDFSGLWDFYRPQSGEIMYLIASVCSFVHDLPAAQKISALASLWHDILKSHANIIIGQEYWQGGHVAEGHLNTLAFSFEFLFWFVCNVGIHLLFQRCFEYWHNWWLYHLWHLQMYPYGRIIASNTFTPFLGLSDAFINHHGEGELKLAVDKVTCNKVRHIMQISLY